MTDQLDFQEDGAGVHLVSPLAGGGDTLCGYAVDAHETGDSANGPMTKTTKRTVTCPDCARLLLLLRPVRVSRRATTSDR